MNSNQTKTQTTFRLCAATGAMLAAPLLLALVALGCGEQKEKAAATVASTETAAQQAQHEAVPAAKTETAAVAESTPAAGDAKQDDGTLPPDIVAVPPEGLSLPGTVVTIAAIGSADVTSVTLTDRVGAKTPFTFDSESNMWKTSYRVPLGVKTDRLALSVTAGTGANRWKRVWVFLQLREGAKEAAAAPDSAR